MNKGWQMPEKLELWLKESAGLSRSLLLSLENDDDWTFVIKMHALLEAALNHLLLMQCDNPAMAQIVSALDTSNDRTGKIALIKAYDLLQASSRMFMRRFSELRNMAVQDVRNSRFDLVDYFQTLERERQKSWKIALTSWMIFEPSEDVQNLALRIPRGAIYNCCFMILLRCYDDRTEPRTQRERILSAIQFLEHRTMFQGLQAAERDNSLFLDQAVRPSEFRR
jgi:hypothetical protein